MQKTRERGRERRREEEGRREGGGEEGGGGKEGRRAGLDGEISMDFRQRQKGHACLGCAVSRVCGHSVCIVWYGCVCYFIFSGN